MKGIKQLFLAIIIVICFNLFFEIYYYIETPIKYIGLIGHALLGMLIMDWLMLKFKE